MKLCPPNFYLKGIVAARNLAGGHMQGLTHLVCARAPAAPAPSNYPNRVCVSLATNANSLDYCKSMTDFSSAAFSDCGADCYDDFTMLGKPYPLDQQIGLSSATPNTKDHLFCPDGQAIQSMKIFANKTGPIKHFYVNCIALPQ